jgi:hypothetical protein
VLKAFLRNCLFNRQGLAIGTTTLAAYSAVSGAYIPFIGAGLGSD